MVTFAFFALSCTQKQQKVTTHKPTPSTKQVFLNKTKDALKNFVKDKANNPDAMKISGMKVAFLCDSACALNFRFVAENKLGGHVNGKAQRISRRIYLRHWLAFMSFLFTLSDLAHFVIARSYSP